MTHILVIGGGITGLTAAYRLQGHAEVTLLEASGRAGGSIQTIHRDGFILESGADCFISEKPGGVELCAELGIELIGTQPDSRRSFIRRDDELVPIPEGFYLMGPSRLGPFLQTPLLSWPAKLRTLLEPLIPANAQADESLASFVGRRLGSGVLRELAQPLLAGIYSADPETLSLRATFPQFLEMEKQGGVLRGLARRRAAGTSGARYSLFVTPRNGMQELIDRLVGRLRTPPRLSAPVTALERTKTGWTVQVRHERLQADAIVLALPAFKAAQLLEPVAPALSRILADIPYSDSTTVNVAYRAPNVGSLPAGAGFVTPSYQKRFVSACTFVNRKFSGRAPEGMVLLRAFLTGTDLGKDAEIITRVINDLEPLLSLKGSPLFASVWRGPAALPHYRVGHVERISQVAAHVQAIGRLALAGNWASGVGIPDCITSATRAATALLDPKLLAG